MYRFLILANFQTLRNFKTLGNHKECIGIIAVYINPQRCNLGLDTRKPVFEGLYGSVCDILASFCSWGEWFESSFVGNPEGSCLFYTMHNVKNDIYLLL